MSRRRLRILLPPCFNTDDGIRRAAIPRGAAADVVCNSFNTDDGIRRAAI